MKDLYEIAVMPVVSYGCEIYCLILKNRNKFMMSENSVEEINWT
jgi:hypothetical protein